MLFQDKETPKFCMLLFSFHTMSYSAVTLKTGQTKQDISFN